MASQPSGTNNELLVVRSSHALFVLKGPKGKNDCFTDEKPLIRIQGININDDELFSEYDENLYLSEYTNYEIIVQNLNGSKAELYHENINIRNKVTPLTKGSDIQSGIINFKGEIGYTDFIIKVNGNDDIKITLEVYPSKLQYKQDYVDIVRDINEEIYNLAYGFLSRTYFGAELNNKQHTSRTEFYSILNYVFERLIRAIDVVINNHNHVLKIEQDIVKFQRIKKTDTLKNIHIFLVMLMEDCCLKKPLFQEKLSHMIQRKTGLLNS